MFGVPHFENQGQKSQFPEKQAAKLVEELYNRIDPLQPKTWMTKTEAELLMLHGGEDGQVLLKNEEQNGRYRIRPLQ